MNTLNTDFKILWHQMTVFHKTAVTLETKTISLQQVEYVSAPSCELPLVSDIPDFPQQENVCTVPWEVQQFPHSGSVDLQKLMENQFSKLVLEEQSIPKD